MKKIFLFLIIPLLSTGQVLWEDKFKQLDIELPSPNSYRTASGAPGHEYWQQRADYKMEIFLTEQNHSISGNETITYFNNSPDKLEYLWLQLDQNIYDKESITGKINQSGEVKENKMNIRELSAFDKTFDGGFKVMSVTDIQNKNLKYTINHTMMRIDLEKPLLPKSNYVFKISWSYNINDRAKQRGRSGYEWFDAEQNALYTIAQFYPRMCMYSDVEGWQNKQFLGAGEFTLIFGNYDVTLNLPDDHIVAATGSLQNSKEVLTAEQIKRLEMSKSSYDQPVFIVTKEEAFKNEKHKDVKKTKKWQFKAENVRDFAWASSRKFIWDAMAVNQENGSTVMAMSLYPKEGNPLWEKYSTKVVAHTLKWYSHYTFPYPYPVAWSIHTDQIGMEYPMICFNGGRPNKDGTYSESTKYGMIGVIIHEVGHNYFPMIVNSDERQWTWMDEGLNTYVQFLTEQHWGRDYPLRRGAAQTIVDYMKGDKDRMSPIMTNSESIIQFGSNAYAKPATALNILRETVVGRELFDFAFKTYANRWKFKHPSPADFFRTIEDATAVDLDWFWRGWFYETDHVDISIKQVKHMHAPNKSPTEIAQLKQLEKDKAEKNITIIRNQNAISTTYEERDTSLIDQYSFNTKIIPTSEEELAYQNYLKQFSTEEQQLIKEEFYITQVSFENVGGLIMPIIIQVEYADNTKEDFKIPVEIWKQSDSVVTKVFRSKQAIIHINLDPYLETADVDRNNNYYPKQKESSKIELFKERRRER